MSVQPIAVHIAARYYQRGPRLALSPDLVAQWTSRIDAEWRNLPSTLRVFWSEHDPYAAFDELAWDVRHGIMRIYAGDLQTTYFGPLHALRARAVHDYHHVLLGADFSYEGERTVARFECKGLDPVMQDVVASEVVGQAACYLSTGTFPTQRLVRGMRDFL
jgi:hypothetical protein